MDQVSELDAAVRRMTEEQQAHLRTVVATVIGCYVNPASRAVVLLDTGDSVLQIMTINADDNDVGALIHSALHHLAFADTSDVPAKEKLN